MKHVWQAKEGKTLKVTPRGVKPIIFMPLWDESLRMFTQKYTRKLHYYRKSSILPSCISLENRIQKSIYMNAMERILGEAHEAVF